MLESRTTLRVRYAETDAMAVVYHGSYLPWLEVARTNLLREQGFPYRDLEQAGFLLPVLEISLKYQRSAVYDDEVTIHVFLRECPSIRIKLDYEIRRGDELLATAQTTHAFVDRQGQPVRPPADFLAGMRAKFGRD